MTKNLQTADRIVKLALSALTVAFYFFGVIQGPFAKALMILSVIVIILFVIKTAMVKDG